MLPDEPDARRVVAWHARVLNDEEHGVVDVQRNDPDELTYGLGTFTHIFTILEVVQFLLKFKYGPLSMVW